jgi:hypothetical protein
MPSAGISRRAARRPAAPWWEELDSEAFRDFPAVRSPRKVGSVEPAATASEAPVPAEHVGRGEAAGRAAVPDRAPGAGDGRRTVTIRGHGAERNLPVARPTLRRHERPGFRPDRAALWAVLLGLFLILVAAASAHAAVAHQLAVHLTR